MPTTSAGVAGVKATDQWREFVRSRYNRDTQFLNLEVSGCGVMEPTAADLPSVAHA